MECYVLRTEALSHLILLKTQWVFFILQTVKNLPAMRETGVQSLGQEEPLEKEMATHSSILI